MSIPHISSHEVEVLRRATAELGDYGIPIYPDSAVEAHKQGVEHAAKRWIRRSMTSCYVFAAVCFLLFLILLIAVPSPRKPYTLLILVTALMCLGGGYMVRRFMLTIGGWEASRIYILRQLKREAQALDMPPTVFERAQTVITALGWSLLIEEFDGDPLIYAVERQCGQWLCIGAWDRQGDINLNAPSSR